MLERSAPGDLIGPLLLGRLERLVFVEPPDAAARREILRTAGKSIPAELRRRPGRVAKARINSYSRRLWRFAAGRLPRCGVPSDAASVAPPTWRPFARKPRASPGPQVASLRHQG